MKKKYVFKKEPGKQYDEDVINVAKRRVTIVVIVVAYIFYQLYSIINNKIAGTNPMTWTGIIVATVLLGGGCLGVLVFSILRMGRDIADAEITESDEEAEKEN